MEAKMNDKIIVAVDAMGGDNAPKELVKGSVEAVLECGNLLVRLFGDKDAIENELAKYEYNKEQIEIVHTTEIIGTGEHPVEAIRKKKDSSLVVGLKSIKEGTTDAFVSAGSSGAILVGGQTLVGRIKGIERPPLAPLIPTAKGVSLLIDCGANVDAKPSYLVQFAKIGTIYMESIVGIENPKVALVNIGAEEEKGNALTKETYQLLKGCPDINFIGNIEAREIPNGDVDIIVCDAFVGNVILKLYEGLASTLIGKIKGGLMSSFKSKIGAILIKPALKKTLKSFQADKYGGAPLLGLKGLVVKTHGNSKSADVKNSILNAIKFKEQNINEKIKEHITKEQIVKEV